jgi:DNA-binding transcriptional MerR regulator
VSGGVFHIGELSRRAGLSAHVIRAWERRYGLLQPARSNGNFRLYTADDLARLRLMQHYVAQSIPPSRAAELVRRARSAAVDRHPGIPRGDVHKALVVLRDSLERYDDGPAERLLRRLLGVFTAGAVLRDVVLPYLRELGHRWQCGETTVAQEHFASCFLEAWMLGMARGRPQSARRCAVLACVPGERHSLGLIAFGLALRDLGWRVAYLGADTPVPSAAQAADALGAEAVVLTAAVPSTLAAAAELIADLAETHPVVLGGEGTSELSWPPLAPRVLPADLLTAAQALTLHPTHAARQPVAG